MLVALPFFIHKFWVGLDLVSQTFQKLLEKKSPMTCILLAGFANNEGTVFAQDLIFCLELRLLSHLPAPEKIDGNQLSGCFC